MGVCPNRDGDGSSKAKVGQLDASLLVDQEVLWLEVTVHDAPPVTEQDGLKDLVEIALGGGRRKRGGRGGKREKRKEVEKRGIKKGEKRGWEEETFKVDHHFEATSSINEKKINNINNKYNF